MTCRNYVIYSLFFLFIIAASSDGIPANEKIARVEKLLTDFDSNSSPGAVIAVIKDGKIIYNRSFGMSNLEYDIPINSKTVFRIASTSKQFTASCIGILALQGKLNLNDRISKFFPELSSVYESVTVYHLIHHTSGIRDYVDLQELAGVGDEQPNYYTARDVLKLLGRQKALNFQPGEAYSYSNSGYLLLGEIVKRVSGKSLPRFARENIFDPLGMTHTHFHDNINMIVKNRAIGYSPVKDGYRICMTNLEIVGDAGVFTTVEDLSYWDQAFYNKKLGVDLIRMMTTPGKLNNGSEIFYAFGLGIDKYRGLKTVSHSGAFVGYKSDIIRFPDQRFSIICMSNLSTFNPSQLCRRIADIFLEDSFPEDQGQTAKKHKELRQPTEISMEKLLDFTGNYLNPEKGKLYGIKIEAKALALLGTGWTVHFVPVSDTVFHSTDTPRDWRIEFSKDKATSKRQAVLFIDGKKKFSLEPIKLISLNSGQLSEYTGIFRSDELNVEYRVVLTDGILYVQNQNNPDVPMIPVLKDQFRLKTKTIKFNRNIERSIVSFDLDMSRIRGIRFKKRRSIPES